MSPGVEVTPLGLPDNESPFEVGQLYYELVRQVFNARRVTVITLWVFDGYFHADCSTAAPDSDNCYLRFTRFEDIDTADFDPPRQMLWSISQLEFVKRSLRTFEQLAMGIGAIAHDEKFSIADVTPRLPSEILFQPNQVCCLGGDAPIDIARAAGAEAISIEGDISADTIHELSALEHLRQLSIVNAGMTDDVLCLLCTLTQLEFLSVSYARPGTRPITHRGLRDILNLRYLVCLDMQKLPLEQSALRELGRCSGLKWLNLRGTCTSMNSVLWMTEEAELEQLFLDETNVGDDALQALTRCRKLVRLNLRKTNVSDAGMEILGKMGNLEYIDLLGTAVGDQGLRQLERLPRLRFVGVGGTKVTYCGLRCFQEMHPTCFVQL